MCRHVPTVPNGSYVPDGMAHGYDSVSSCHEFRPPVTFIRPYSWIWTNRVTGEHAGGSADATDTQKEE